MKFDEVGKFVQRVFEVERSRCWMFGWQCLIETRRGYSRTCSRQDAIVVDMHPDHATTQELLKLMTTHGVCSR